MATRSKSLMSRRNRQRSQKRSQRGGAQGAYPDSAWGFQMNNLGNGWTQFMNSLTLQPGQNQGTVQSNDIVPIKNINAQNTSKMMMNGGRKHHGRKHHGKSRGKKGGYWGAVLEQAAVPLALLGMQQTYGKRHTRRNRGHNRSMKRGH